MAQRRPTRRDGTSEGGQLVGLVKQADFFPKTLDDFRVRTEFGGTVALITFCIMAYLFIMEFSLHLQVDTVDHLTVDKTMGQRLTVNLSLRFPNIPCKNVHLDLMDQTNNFHVDAEQAVGKTRLNEYGEPLHANEKSDGGEGCRMKGFFRVKKVAGNFHIALGKSGLADNKAHIHEFRMSEVNKFNVSHVIEHLSFGDQYPGQVNPLDGVEKHIDHGSAIYKYFVKVVPTKYQKYSGKVISTNQFSVTEHFQPVAGMSATYALPGVFFMYDFCPLQVEYQERRAPFFTFVTSTCAIIGGVFAVSTMIDYFVHDMRFTRTWDRVLGIGPARSKSSQVPRMD